MYKRDNFRTVRSIFVLRSSFLLAEKCFDSENIANLVIILDFPLYRFVIFYYLKIHYKLVNRVNASLYSYQVLSFPRVFRVYL